jgi:hypothetical protein
MFAVHVCRLNPWSLPSARFTHSVEIAIWATREAVCERICYSMVLPGFVTQCVEVRRAPPPALAATNRVQ